MTYPDAHARINAILARLDAHNEDADLLHARIAALETDVERHAERLDELTRLCGSHAASILHLQSARIAASVAPESASALESATGSAREWLESSRIAPSVAPESVVNVSEVSQEPGNATEAHSPWQDDLRHFVPAYLYAEVAAALRVYRKVQACRVEPDHHFVRCPDGATWKLAENLLAWLKEGEA